MARHQKSAYALQSGYWHVFFYSSAEADGCCSSARADSESRPNRHRLACEILAVINIFVHCSAHYFHPLHEFPEDFRTDVGLKFLRWLSWETRQFVWRDPDRLGIFVFLQRNWCVLKLRNPLFSHSQILVWFDSKIWIRALSLRPVKLWWKPLSIVVVLLKIK